MEWGPMIRMSDQDRELGRYEKFARRVKGGQKVVETVGMFGGVAVLAKRYGPVLAEKVGQALAKKS